MAKYKVLKSVANSIAASITAKRSMGGGFPSHTSHPQACGVG
jgi:hypothetical protein